MNLKNLLCSAFLALFTFIGSVNAAPFLSVTFHGHISTGTDVSGIFGAPNQDLSGLEYTQTITLSSDPHNYSHIEGIPYWYDSCCYTWFAGTKLEMLYPAVAVVEVNGQSLNITLSSLPTGQQFMLDESRIWASFYGEIDTLGTFGVSNAANQRDGNLVPFFPINGRYGSFAADLLPGAGQSYFQVTGLNNASFVGNAERFEVSGFEVPEPTSAAVFAIGLLGMLVFRHKSRARQG